MKLKTLIEALQDFEMSNSTTEDTEVLFYLPEVMAGRMSASAVSYYCHPIKVLEIYEGDLVLSRDRTEVPSGMPT